MSRIDANGMALLEKRYLENETAEGMFRRASGGNEQYFQLMESLRFMPNSPTLFNAGRNNGCTLSACFVFDIGDYMLYHEGRIMEDSIVRTREKAIGVAKAGGGVGYYLGNIRPKGSLVNSVHRVACGPVGVLRDLNGIEKLTTQGGKRELAQMAVLPVTHPDIRSFIHCKDADPQALSSFNISVSWDDASVNKARNDFTPAGDPWRELWLEQVDSAWSHGCPGMFFVDTVNRFNPNPHLGLMRAPNPCGETPNRSNEPCNLGSLCLPRFFDPGNRSVDWNALEEAAWTATMFLDDILDRNVFPHPDIAAAALLTRKLGLGYMGWADLLAMMHVHYDTQEAVDLGARISKLVNEVATGASEHMAKEKGPYKGFSDRTLHAPRRNETCTSVAPTGSIGVICGVLGKGIEPWFAQENSRVTSEGLRFVEGVPAFVEEQLDGFVPKTTHEIHWKWHVAHQAAFQANTHLGVSKTINMCNNATRQDVSDAYAEMHRTGCKGGTVYRNECRPDQVLRETKGGVYSRGVDLPVRKVLQDECDAKRVKLKVGGVKFYLHPGLYEDGTLGEIFVSGDFGSTLSGLLDAFSKTFSVALQYGTPLAALVNQHKGNRFEPSGPTNRKDVPVCTSIIDLIVRYLEARFLGGGSGEPCSSGMLCPDCGSIAVYQSGCLSCTNDGCHWTRCG